MRWAAGGMEQAYLPDVYLWATLNEMAQMAGTPSEFRSTMVRARALGRTLLQIYGEDKDSTPAELLELLDIAEARLESAGYQVDGKRSDTSLKSP